MSGAEISTAQRQKPPVGERMFYGVCRFISVGFSRLYFPGTVHHRNRLPKNGPFIVAPIHRSNVDWLVVARITKHRLRYIVKAEVWKSKFAGRLLEMLGAFPVHRGAADREAVHRALEALETGEPLVMFPEGTRRSGQEVEPLQEGAVYVALRAGVPIVPIGISHTERSMPRGAKFPRPIWTRVVIGEPLHLNQLIDDTVKPGRVPRSAIRDGSEQLRVALQEVLDEAEKVHKSKK